MKLLIDSGHGTETAGKRSIFHKINNKTRLKENNFNEAVANKLSVLLNNSIFLTPEWWDVPLKDRVRLENNLYIPNKTIFLSIHADAYKKKDVALGGRFYYHSEKGKEIALHFTKMLKSGGYPISLRPVKQANFYVLKYTKSPAILFEAGFMTSIHDLDYLVKDSFRNDTARLLKEAFLKL